MVMIFGPQKTYSWCNVTICREKYTLHFVTREPGTVPATTYCGRGWGTSADNFELG